MKNPLLGSRLKRAAVALALAAALPVSLAPAAMASDSEGVYAEECPEGYKGVIVGYNDPKWGNHEVYACTNI